MPVLLVLAAGLGSRYGGLKQMEGVGPNGETILDFTVFDAVRAGFDEVVFVIRPEMEQAFRQKVIRKFGSRIRCRLVHQTLDSMTGGFAVPAERVKPWGTGHAVLVAREQVKAPFAVVNADDYYGPDSLKRIATHLSQRPEGFAMVGYVLRNTLSDHGTVARGICSVDKSGKLEAVVETTAIAREGEGAVYFDEQGKRQTLSGDELVSMNLWGFPPTFLDDLGRGFKFFLEKQGDLPSAEYFLPAVVSRLIEEEGLEVQVLVSEDRWFGVTYREDVGPVRARLRQLANEGVYPDRLW